MRRSAVRLLVLALAALAPPCLGATPEPQADRVLVEKQAHRLTLFHRGAVLRAYTVALGTGGLGRKERQGDRLVPEGEYTIDGRNAASAFHRALHVSYPNAEDRARARALGVSPGGDIMIHGIKNGYGWVGHRHLLRDWTLGCIAVTDEEIEEIWRLVPDGTLVEIRP
jgi:murein L,D-transpeptidase YafK